MRGRCFVIGGLVAASLFGACGSDDAPSSAGAGGAVDARQPFTRETCHLIEVAISARSVTAYAGEGGVDFEEARRAMKELASSPPAEISADVEVMAGVIERAAAIIADAEFDLRDPRAFLAPEHRVKVQELEERFSALNSLEIQAAGNRVRSYLRENCPAG